jgi:hypothetical protein
LTSSPLDVYKLKNILIVNWKELVLDFDIVQEVIHWQLNLFPKYTQYEIDVMNVKQIVELIKIENIDEKIENLFSELKSFKELYDDSLAFEPRQ